MVPVTPGVPEATVREWMRKLDGYLRPRYGSLPQYDDLLGCAYLGLAEAIAAARKQPVRDLAGYAIRAGWLRAQGFLRSPENDSRRISRHGGPLPELLPLAVIAERQEYYPRLTVPDFAPRLIDWLVAQDELARMPARRRRVLVLGAYHGCDRAEIARRLNLSRPQVGRLLSGVDVVQPGRRISQGNREAGPVRAGYKGVLRNRREKSRQRSKPWRVLFSLAGRPTYMGEYATEEEAALVYDACVVCYWEGQGYLNLLPDEVRDAGGAAQISAGLERPAPGAD